MCVFAREVPRLAPPRKVRMRVKTEMKRFAKKTEHTKWRREQRSSAQSSSYFSSDAIKTWVRVTKEANNKIKKYREQRRAHSFGANTKQTIHFRFDRFSILGFSARLHTPFARERDYVEENIDKLSAHYDSIVVVAAVVAMLNKQNRHEKVALYPPIAPSAHNGLMQIQVNFQLHFSFSSSSRTNNNNLFRIEIESNRLRTTSICKPTTGITQSSCCFALWYRF